VKAFGDEHSRHFYMLVAKKIPQSVIREKLSEIKQGGARSPQKVFTSAMNAYATDALQKKTVSTLMSSKEQLFRI
jgi:hypothetical protein